MNILDKVPIINNQLLAGINHIRDNRLDWAEFGVYKGQSALFLEKYLKDNDLFLFDSFVGLPEAWKFKDGRLWGNHKAGHFKLKENEIPVFNNSNVHIIKGWFKDTVPVFASKHKEPLGLIHIDCDIYSSTKDVLEGINNLIVSGTIIVFDEFYNYDNENEGWKDHEYKAFIEYIEKYNRVCEYIARTKKEQVVLRITR